MKTLILLLIPLISFSQLRISTEVDPRNALFGSKVNEASYDGTFSIGYRIQDFQVQMTYETFQEIGFKSYMIHAGKVLNPEGKFNYVLLGGLGMIERNVNWLNIVWHPSVSFSVQGEYHLGRIFLTARPEIRYRGDLKKFIGSGYIGIGIKL